MAHTLQGVSTRRPSFLVLGVVLLLVLVAMACQGTQQPAAQTAKPDAAAPAAPTAAAATPTQPATPAKPAAVLKEQPRYGGAFELVGNATLTSDVDPHMSACCAPFWPFLSNRLIELGVFDLSLQPGVAERWVVSSDFRTITFTIRQGIKFHNLAPVSGRELTAEDVAYSLRRIAGLENPKKLSITNFPRSSVVSSMESAVAIDRYTVKVTTKRVDAGILLGIADNRNSIIAKEEVDANGDLKIIGKSHIGIGSFKFVSWEPDVSVVFERNPDYWEKDRIGGRTPYLDRVRYTNIPDRSTQLAALRTGQIDLVGGIAVQPANVQDLLKTNPDLKVHRYLGGCCGNLGVGFMTEKPPFNDIRLRKAFHLMIDRDVIANTFFGQGTKTEVWVYSTPVSPMFPQFALPQEEISQMPGYRRPKTEDFAEAKRLLSEAGYPQGLTVKLDHSTGAGINPAYAEGCAILQDQFRRDFADLPNMKIVCQPQQAQSALNVDFKHEMTFWWSYAYEMEPGLQVHLTYACKGGRNYQGNCDQKWMDQWEQQQAEFDPAKRRALLLELQRYTINQFWRANLWEAKVANVYNPSLRAIEEWFGPSAGINFNSFFHHLWKAPR